MLQPLIFTNKVEAALEKLIADRAPSGVFILTDTNVRDAVVVPLQKASAQLASVPVITIDAGDCNKSLEQLAAVWASLNRLGATRHSLLINIGGGMVTDLGAFAAATYMRGMKFVNLPTTLLAAVDASVGGKTGINFQGIKNLIGVFREADTVVISSRFFATLPAAELRSGYAEMLKHGLLNGADEFNELIEKDVAEFSADELLSLVEKNVTVKRRIVLEDPTENGIRRALNLGHTAGHAFESLKLDSPEPLPHGYAVAFGMVTELVLSHLHAGFPSDLLYRFAHYVKEVYGTLPFTCADYDHLLALMAHDKKNASADAVNFTLLRAPGQPVIDNIIPSDEIRAALDITLDLL